MVFVVFPVYFSQKEQKICKFILSLCFKLTLFTTIMFFKIIMQNTLHNANFEHRGKVFRKIDGINKSIQIWSIIIHHLLELHFLWFMHSIEHTRSFNLAKTWLWIRHVRRYNNLTYPFEFPACHHIVHITVPPYM